VARGLCERGQTHHRPTVVDDCGLVVGELIANAIQADANTIDVSVELHHGRIGLAVTDDAHGWLAGPSPTRPGCRGGRGLQIIAALAACWGATIDEDRHTIVWVQLFCNPLATNGVQCRYR
jgi:two-component sensor histidine kinase